MCKKLQSTLFAFVFVGLLFTGHLAAQGFQGTLRGNVQDPTGALVPGATVTLTSQETGETRTQESTDAGTFTFPALLIGDYTVAIELSGFKRYEQKDVHVRANQVVDVVAKLELGDVSETVSVVGGGELVKTTTVQLETTFDASAVTGLPLNDPFGDGDPISLAVLVPGVSSHSGGVAGQGGSVGGNRPRNNNFVIDGVDNNDPSVTGTQTPVIQDAVQEFSLLTNQFSAEFGHSTAGQFITTTKSGTNNFHGGGWWYNQNRHLNSLDGFTRAGMAEGDAKPRYDRNRFGGQAGGPIVRDRFFIFGAYEYRNLSLAGAPSGEILVPTAAGLAALTALAGNPATGVSPINVGLLRERVPVAPRASTSTTVLNQATNQLVPIELGAFNLLTPQFDRSHLFLITSDYQTTNHRVSGRFHYSKNPFIESGALPTPEFTSDRTVNSRRFSLADVWTVTPHVVNELRFGYIRYVDDITVNLPAAPGPADVFGNYAIDDLSLQIGPQSNFPQGRFSNTYQYSDNLSFTGGAHSIKVGGEFRNAIAASAFLPRGRGDFHWATLDQFARDLFPANVAIRGVGSGLFSYNRPGFSVFVQDSWKMRKNLTLDLGVRYEFTKVARDTALQELNALANITSIRTETGADGRRVFDTLPKHHQDALLAYVGESVIFRKPEPDKNNWAPRIGLAWDVNGDGKTSIRAGFGVAHDVIFANIAVNQLPPQFQAENRESNACLLTPRPAWCAFAGANPGNPVAGDIRFSNIGFIEGGSLFSALPTTAFTDRATARRLTANYVRDDISPETYTWSLSIQREVSPNTVVEARYIGNHAVHLFVQRQLNTGIPNPNRLPIFAQVSDALGRSYGGAPTLAAFNAANGRLLAPYGFTGALTQFTPDGQSWYHGGSLSVQRKFTQYMGLNANYTWSKATDLIENELFTSQINPRRPFNHYDIAPSKGLSGLNHSHKFVASWVLEAPPFTGGSSFINMFLSGWGVNGSWIAESGQAFSTLSFADLNGNLDTAGDPAFENPNGMDRTGTGVNFVCFNGGRPSIASSAANCGGAGNVVGYVAQNPNAQFVGGAAGAAEGVGLNLTGRGNMISAGVNVVNLSFFKNMAIAEDVKLKFAATLTNAFNHSSPAIGNGAARPDSNHTHALSFPGYANPTSSQFLNEKIFSGGLGQSPFQRVIQLEMKLIF